MSSDGQAQLVEPLTEREREVLEHLAQGKSDRELADALVVSVNTIKWHNRQIYAKLGVADRQQAVEQAKVLGLLQVKTEEQARRSLLPDSLMPLIGRDKELEELTTLLLDGRAKVVSVVGPGGVGKTRLALEVARRLAPHFVHGAAFVSLAPLGTADAIASAVAQAIGFKPTAGTDEKRDVKSQLLDYLRDRKWLIVLDNFEHLLSGAPLLLDILAVAPETRLLVTSRERLKLQVEQVYLLQGLSFSRWDTIEQARRYPAVQLFLQYGRRLRPGYTLETGDLGALQRIFELVQGMPLAIILAAAWLELFNPAEIAAEIGRSLDFLQADYQDLPERQRSMRAVFETSWARLSERERTLFAALSVFRGSFTIDAARAVAGAQPQELRRLISRSLLVRSRDGRFEVHELLRQYAAAQLADVSSQEANVRDLHSVYYMDLLIRYELLLKGAQAESCLWTMERDFQNHQAAWTWAVEQRKFALLGAAAFSLATFCLRAGHYEEGLATLGSALDAAREEISEHAQDDAAILTSTIRLLAFQCALRYETGAFQEAEVLGAQARSLLERRVLQDIDMRHERGLALLHLARLFAWQDRTTEAEPMLKQSAALFDALGNSWERADTLYELAHVAMRQAKFEQAVAYSRQAVKLFAALGDISRKAMAQVALGFDLAGAGEEDEGEQKIRESIEAFREMGDETAAARAMLFLAETSAYRGRFEQAEALAATAAEAHTDQGIVNFAAMSDIRWCLAVLHLGRYEAVLARVPAILDIAQRNNAAMNIARAWFLSGCAQLAQGATGNAREELEEAADGLRGIGSWDYLCEGLAALSIAYVAEGRLSHAAEALREGIRIAVELRAAVYLATLLAAASLLAIRTEGRERAIELYALAERHPYVANSRWFADMCGRHIAAVADTLAPDDVDGARKRADTRDLWEIVNQLVGELRETFESLSGA